MCVLCEKSRAGTHTHNHTHTRTRTTGPAGLAVVALRRRLSQHQHQRRHRHRRRRQKRCRCRAPVPTSGSDAGRAADVPPADAPGRPPPPVSWVRLGEKTSWHGARTKRTINDYTVYSKIVWTGPCTRAEPETAQQIAVVEAAPDRAEQLAQRAVHRSGPRKSRSRGLRRERP